MTVVKIGGSLFDLPGLGPGLRAWLAGFDGPVLLVPGGGALVDSIRTWDRLHGLGDELSHTLAVRAMGLTAAILAAMTDRPVLDVVATLRDRDLPRSWAVTSDSIAARVAAAEKAVRLVLLKSVDVPAGTSWPEAVRNGWVDGYFPSAAARLKCSIEVVNFRRWLAENGYEK